MLPVDVISDEEFHITSPSTFKQIVGKSLQSLEMKAIILATPTPSFWESGLGLSISWPMDSAKRSQHEWDKLKA